MPTLIALTLSKSADSAPFGSTYSLAGIVAYALYDDASQAVVTPTWSAVSGTVSGTTYTPAGGGTDSIVASYTAAGVTKTCTLRLTITSVYGGTTETQDQFVTRAFRMVGIGADGQALTGEELENGRSILADLNMAWFNEGINLNSNHDLSFPMPTYSVVIGSDANNYICTRNHQATAATQPIVGADWQDYWQLLTIDSSTTPTTWALGATYTAPHQFALPQGLMYVKNARLKDTNGYDMPVALITETEYYGIVNKIVGGKPGRLWVSERPWNAKQAFMWPSIPDNSGYVLYVNGVYLMGDFTASATELDAPPSARLALVYDLASLVADFYQRPQVAQQFAARAVALKRNFFRTYQESKTSVSQIRSRFRYHRWPLR